LSIAGLPGLSNANRQAVIEYRQPTARRNQLLTIRKAEWRDVPALYRLIDYYAAEQVMLRRKLSDLCENFPKFTVAEIVREPSGLPHTKIVGEPSGLPQASANGNLLGCGALHFYSRGVAEIRSLCVDPSLRSNGIGRAIANTLLDEAERSGLKTVFALTTSPAFFRKLGFREVPREKFPEKIRRDCLHCDRYSTCQEMTLSLDLALRCFQEAESPPETAEVSG
jgi:N-acetylglutamate synthase-like GNAT family acetyltransferase